MMDQKQTSRRPWLAWIFPDTLANKLNVAPTLNATQGLSRCGWRVDLLVCEYDGDTIEIAGVNIVNIRRRDIYLLRQVFYHVQVLIYLLKHWNTIDVILFRAMSAPWIAPLRFVRLLSHGQGPLFVMDTRSLPMEGEKAPFKDRLRGKFVLLMNALANRFTDGQTAITSHMAEALHIPPEKLWGVWPSGVNIEMFRPAAAARYWPQEDQPVQVIYLGVFSAERNLLNLCRAVEQVNREGMWIELSLVGDGKEREKLQAFASQSKGKVHILPRVPHEQVPAVLSKMHVGALPFPDELKFRVSSAIKMFEYLGSGMPILATRIVAHTDVIGDQICAFWAEESSSEGLTAALRDLWKRRSSLPSMEAAAFQIVQNYTWIASISKLDAALRFGMRNTGKISL